VRRRPVIAFDFESSAPAYKRNIKNIAARLQVPVPVVPDELDIYLEHDLCTEPATAKLLALLRSANTQDRFNLLESSLKQKPDALMIVDPLEMLFRIDTGKKINILALYTNLKLLLSQYPRAAIILTFNMRKQDLRNGLPDLLTNPRGFLQEVCGTLDIHNRADVRLGMNEHGAENRVINGIRRGEDFDPLILRPVGDSDNLAGFELVAANDGDLVDALTAAQLGYWKQLPKDFKYDDVVPKIVPKSSFSRLCKRASYLGALSHDPKSGLYGKVNP
jgi:hypothetical protein